MKDTLPLKPYKRECGIVNLDSVRGPGSHWVCYTKRNKNVFYYNSFGNISPPLEIIAYFKNCDIKYNFNQEQTYNSFICGHLCLLNLYNENQKM